MKIRIEILGNRVGNGQSLQDVIGDALKKRGFTSFTEFATKVAEIRKSKATTETQGLSRIMLGQTSRLEPDKAKAYAQVLELPEQELLKFGGMGKYHKNKPIIVEDSTDVTQAVKKLGSQRVITLEDLVKELLYLEHQ